MVELRLYERLWLAIPCGVWFVLSVTSVCAVFAALLACELLEDLTCTNPWPFFTLVLVGVCVGGLGFLRGMPHHGATDFQHAVLNGDLRNVHWGIAEGCAALGNARILVYDGVRHPEVVAALLRAGVDPDGVPGCHVPLSRACRLDLPRSVQLLLDAGAAVNAVAGDGMAPLHCCRSAACAELLLARGASLDVRTTCGQTPLDVAVAMGRHDVAQVLVAEARWRRWKRPWIASHVFV